MNKLFTTLFILLFLFSISLPGIAEKTAQSDAEETDAGSSDYSATNKENQAYNVEIDVHRLKILIKITHTGD
jgi:hypothetical protein